MCHHQNNNLLKCATGKLMPDLWGIILRYDTLSTGFRRKNNILKFRINPLEKEYNTTKPRPKKICSSYFATHCIHQVIDLREKCNCASILHHSQTTILMSSVLTLRAHQFTIN